jgi:ribosomal protein S18 acetylase RimI-like enzyme
MDDLNCWTNKNSKEIARVVVAKEYQGQGIAYKMVKNIEVVLQKRGCKAIHLSAAKINIPAYKTYIKAGFTLVGEADMYGSNYYLLEKEI